MTDLLQPAVPTNAFLKMGIFGITGTGKSFTASKVAIGLSNHIESKKPIAYFDTEPGSDFLIEALFYPAKKELLVRKSRSFLDLMGVMNEAAKKCDILIIDSITHPWQEVCESYMKRKNLSMITIRHWQELKRTWWQFTQLYVTSNLHIIMCGRSTDIWKPVMGEDSVIETQKVGTKMKTETDTGYEPSLLVELETVQQVPEPSGRQIRRAWVVKDRFNAIDGCCFDNPTFDDFLPHIGLLRIGQRHETIAVDSSSEELFGTHKNGQEVYIKRQNLIEGIKNEIWLIHSGQSEQSKKNRLELLERVFGTHIMGEVEQMNIETLAAGISTLKLARTVPDITQGIGAEIALGSKMKEAAEDQLSMEPKPKKKRKKKKNGSS